MYRTLLGIVVILAWAGTAQAQPQQFALGSPQPVAPSKHGVAGVKFVPNLPALRKGGGDFSLALPGGPLVTLRRAFHEDRGNGDLLWRGKVLQDDDSLVLLTVKGGVMVGTIQTLGTTYVVRAGKDGQVLEQVVPRTAPRDAQPILLPAVPDGQAGVSRQLGAASAAKAAPGGGTTQIDVMVLYTNAVAVEAGGRAAVEAEIQSFVDLSNQTFKNSRVKATYRLVHAGLAPDAFQGDPLPSSILPTFARDADVATLRSFHGADLVALYVNDVYVSSPDRPGSGLCGIAVGNNIANPAGGAAHQIFDRSTCPDLFTYVHENGHLLGMSHNPEDAGGPGENYYPFGYGHYVIGVFGTMMSYPGPTIAFFSNPKTSYQGYPTGIPDERDNAQVATLNAAIIAAQSPPGTYDPPSTEAPPAPSGLIAQNNNPNEIRLAWLDNSSGAAQEDNFEIERGTDGVSFQPWATTPENTSVYVDGGLNPGDRFFYRVRAVNGLGTSGYSNVATTTVGLPPSAPSNVQATGISSQTIQISWTDNSSNELGFAIEFFINGDWEFVDEAPANATSYSYYPLLAGYTLSPGTTYSFRLSAYNDFGFSGAVEVQGTTLAAPTSAPTAASTLTLTPVKSGTGANAVFAGVQVSWLDNSTDEAGFILERCKVGGPKNAPTCLFEPLRTVGGTLGTGVRQFFDANFSATDYKGSYRYQVTALNQAGSAAAAIAQVTLK